METQLKFTFSGLFLPTVKTKQNNYYINTNRIWKWKLYLNSPSLNKDTVKCKNTGINKNMIASTQFYYIRDPKYLNK